LIFQNILLAAYDEFESLKRKVNQA